MFSCQSDSEYIVKNIPVPTLVNLGHKLQNSAYLIDQAYTIKLTRPQLVLETRLVFRHSQLAILNFSVYSVRESNTLQKHIYVSFYRNSICHMPWSTCAWPITADLEDIFILFIVIVTNRAIPGKLVAPGTNTNTLACTGDPACIRSFMV